MCQLCRRDFIRGGVAFGAASLFSSPLMAQAKNTNMGSPKLPARGEFTIANAYVMTMDGTLGDVAGGSVHVRNGEIIGVGKDVKGGGDEDRWRGHDRHAWTGRDPLAYVEHAVP